MISHLQLHHLLGGFVGVDIFFVISGYLIGSILLLEVAQHGRINYLNFYERRIRRIMPALGVMLLVVGCVAYKGFLPTDLVDFSKTGIAAILFSSNIYLSRSSGYFDLKASDNLLTHTWSLGVEEQFYMFLPPLLTFFRRRVADGTIGRPILWIAAASFAASIPAAYLMPTGAFYLLPTRIWELLLGTLTYIYAPRLMRPSIQAVLAGIGLLAICVPIYCYTTQTVFPGLAAFPPCAGAVLLIATGGTWIHRVMSRREFVLVGQMSYSLYLWHWPVIVYNRIYPGFSGEYPHTRKLLLCAVSMILGYISWRWVETPIRRGRLKPSRKTLFAWTGAVGASMLALLIALVFSGGAAFRFSPAEQNIASYRQIGGIMEHFRVGTCFVEEPSETNLPNWNDCLQPDPNRPNYLLLGSSVMAQLRDALEQTYPEIHFLQATAPSCDVQIPDSSYSHGCAALMHYIFSDYLRRNHIDAVFFQVEPNLPSSRALSSVLDFCREHGIRAYVLGSPVEFNMPEPALAIEYARDPRKIDLASHIDATMSQDPIDRSVTLSHGGTYISMYDTICPAGRCRAFAAPNTPIASDQEHLTLPGTFFATRMWRAHDLLYPLTTSIGGRQIPAPHPGAGS
jgi:peptidoglycan/LPS O-acetylase OafA/YrhL